MRWIGVDLHKHYAHVVELSEGGGRASYRFSLPEGIGGFCASLTPKDQVVLEASTNSFRFGEIVSQYVERVVVSNPAQTRGMVSRPSINDEKAAEALAQLLQTGFVQPVWTPPASLRALRCQVGHYLDLNRMRTQTLNRIRGLFQQELTDYQPGPTIGIRSREVLDEQFRGEPRHRLYLCSLLRQYNLFNAELAEIERSFGSWCRESKEATLLMTIPGMGPIIAAMLVAQIGDIKRFPSAEHLCSYAGLVPRVYQSGTVLRRGRITRAGRSGMRWALHMCIWSQGLSKYSCSLTEFRKRLALKRPKLVAQVAACRKLLSIIWSMLSHGSSFREEDAELNARKSHRLAQWPEPSPEAYEIPDLKDPRPSRKSVYFPKASRTQ